MVFPINNLTRIWVRGRFVDVVKAAREDTSYGLTGPVQFIPQIEVALDPGTKQVLGMGSFVASPSPTDGYFAINLPATNDPDVNPVDWKYKVVEPTGREYLITVPYDTPVLVASGDPLDGEQVLELANVVPDPDNPSGTVQLLVGQTGRGIADVLIDENDHWVVEFTDGVSTDLGAVTLPAVVTPDIVAAKGDLVVGLADDTPGRKAVGTNGQTLVADSADATGLRWTSTPMSPPVGLTDGTTVATDASLGNLFRVTVAGDRTLAAPTSPADGQRAVWQVTASGGSRTVTLATGAGGFVLGTDISAITATPTDTTDFIGAIYDGSADRWRVVAYAKGY